LTASGEMLSPDRFQVTAESFEDRRRDVVRRVLRDYGIPLATTLERLSVARRFDRQAFDMIVQTFGTALPLDQFERIADLSFVTKGDDGFLTIHNAIAETIRETLTPQMRATSVQALFQHFEERARVATAREVTEKNVIALVESAFLRLAQGAEGYVTWLSGAAYSVHRTAPYASVAGLWRETAGIIETRLGPEHPDTRVCCGTGATLPRRSRSASAPWLSMKRCSGPSIAKRRPASTTSRVSCGTRATLPRRGRSASAP
jgi:hypothetical protein